MVRTWSLGLATIVGLLVAGRLLTAAPVPEKRPLDPKIRELRLEQVKALKELLDNPFTRLKIEKDKGVAFVAAVFDLGEAELELAETKEAELAALEGMVKRLKEAEREVEELRTAGLLTRGQVAEMRAARLKAEIQREKWKRR